MNTNGNHAFLALGSNIGDKTANLRAALEAIAALPGTRLIATSSIFHTPPWGKTDQDWFANAALEIETGLGPTALLDAVLAIEIGFGRERRERWGPRVIDIDVLAYGDITLNTPTLTLPHPAMAKRAFVLLPLQEIAPDFKVRGQSIPALLAGLDQSGIAPIAPLREPMSTAR
jgi:2-amino-4-hydroxy-6-hydroxymethyldihydropteridine diphosphokinase